jgi:ATP-dependent DNA helicase DinG
MRSATDRGVIAIMDVRLFTKGYGRTFLRSLPPSPVIRQMSDVGSFYEKE